MFEIKKKKKKLEKELENEGLRLDNIYFLNDFFKSILAYIEKNIERLFLIKLMDLT